MDDRVEDQFSPEIGEQGQNSEWEDKPEWGGISNDGMTPMSEDNNDPTDVDEPPQAITKPTSQVTVKPKKALFIRDLIKTQIHNTPQPNTLESKKRRLTGGDDRCVTFDR